MKSTTKKAMASSNTSSDFNQWLHAMKMVARLPGGMPPEFRRKVYFINFKAKKKIKLPPSLFFHFSYG